MHLVGLRNLVGPDKHTWRCVGLYRVFYFAGCHCRLSSDPVNFVSANWACCYDVVEAAMYMTSSEHMLPSLCATDRVRRQMSTTPETRNDYIIGIVYLTVSYLPTPAHQYPYCIAIISDTTML